jgi:hypothetical protein
LGTKQGPTELFMVADALLEEIVDELIHYQGKLLGTE